MNDQKEQLIDLLAEQILNIGREYDDTNTCENQICALTSELQRVKDSFRSYKSEIDTEFVRQKNALQRQCEDSLTNSNIKFLEEIQRLTSLLEERSAISSRMEVQIITLKEKLIILEQSSPKNTQGKIIELNLNLNF
jgi:hypothetical protein